MDSKNKGKLPELGCGSSPDVFAVLAAIPGMSGNSHH